MTALGRRLPITLGTVVPVAESATQHIRNALMLLSLLSEAHPFVPAFHPEISRAERRAHAALTMVEHHAPAHFAVAHLEKAILTLLEAELAWDVLPEVPAAIGRLLRALFALDHP
ncbi:MAG TPA: hypothetical protein VJN62_02265 [Gemmatimonadales bacterium]|nr:hypothetical protein [Gemmatimonadales bacterium]